MLNLKRLLAIALFTAVLSMPQSVFGDITSDLIAYWTFDETQEQIVYNHGPTSGYDGVLGSDSQVDSDDPMRTAQGIANSALSFDGADDYVLLPHLFDVGSSGITIAAMVEQTDSTGYQYIMSNSTVFNDRYIRIGFDADNGCLRVVTMASSGAKSTYISEQSYVGSWHHIAVTREGATGILYVDGQHVADFEAAGGDIGAMGNWFIGQSGAGGDFFSGILDEVRVYDRDLRSEDIAELYASLPRVPGDTDNDGDVDLNDFSVLKTNFGNPGDWSDGNFDGDAQVDMDDFIILKNHFSGSVPAAIPEPASLTILLVLGAPCLALMRKSS